jgi:peptide/nickel transport system substrate-binding protein
METRFGFKDFVLVSLVVVLIVVVLLGMKQIDRQWAVMQAIQQQGTEQTRLLANIQRTLSQGVPIYEGGTSASTSTTQSTPSAARDDAFANLKEAEQHPDFARGDWLIDNFGTKLAKATPVVSSDLYADWLQAKVIEWLVWRDPDTLEYHPQLATNWKISDDGMSFTFYLRRGVLWSDGEPFTADDVLFSYQLIMNEKVDAARQRAYYQKIKSLVKKNDYEVVFTMSEPYYESFDLCGTISVVPKHFYSKYTPQQINENPGLLMGSGPYKFRDPAAWRPGQKVELVRNELYWGEPGTFDRIIFLEVEEEAAEETMFGNGELDVFATQPEQYKRLLGDKAMTSRANHFEFESPMNGYYFIAWNQKLGGKPTRFADPRVRKAMTMLTDRDRINKEVYLGFATTISGPFTAGSPQSDPGIKPLPYDPDAAKALLVQAGYKDDGSGTLKGPDGEPFTVKLTYPNKNATFERVVLFIKDSFAKAGVTFIQDPVDWPVLQKKLDTRDFDAISLGWGGSVESDLYQEFDSSQIADQGDNFMSYVNPKFDELAREARRTVDFNKRMALWHKCHAILHEDQPYTFLCSRQSLRFMDKRIENVRPSKIGLNYIYRYAMPLPWYVPKPMQKYKEH